jgi:hypothetical protein
MSQGDYLKHKKNANILTAQSKLPSVLKSTDYTHFKSFTLANTIVDSSPTYNILKVPDRQMVFDMLLDASASCPEFILCRDTQNRPNRKLIDGEQSTCFPVIKPPGMSVPTYYNGSTKKRPENVKCIYKNKLCNMRTLYNENGPSYQTSAKCECT